MKLLKIDDVAIILSKAPRTIRNWLSGIQPAPAGFPNPVKLGGSVRWQDNKIQDYINSLPVDNRFTQIKCVTASKFDSVSNNNNGQKIEPRRGRGRPRKIPLALA